MKKKFVLISIILLSILIVGCDNSVTGLSTYNVTFDAQGGTPATTTISVEAGATVKTFPSQPVYTGYSFGGWYTEKNGAGSQFTESTPVTNNITVYAKWSGVQTIIVTFDYDDNGNTPPTLITVNSGGFITQFPAAPTLTGYYFGGWWTEKNGGGTQVSDATPINGNLTVYAYWTTEPIYTITFDPDGGVFTTDTGTTTSVSLIVEDGKSLGILPTAPTKAHYNFEGWYTDRNGGGQKFTGSTIVQENLTVYANWTNVPVYTVTFDPDGGFPAPADETVESGGTVSLPTEPLNSGYYFGGWWTEKNGDGNEFLTSTPITSNITLYAKWNAQQTFTVTFDGEGGEPEIEILHVISGASLGTLSIQPSREGYDFAGWYTEPDGGVLFDPYTVITENTTVYAHWTQALFTVTFVWNDGSSRTDTREVLFDKSLGDSMPDIPISQVEGYTFLQWDTNQDYDPYTDAKGNPSTTPIKDTSSNAFDKTTPVTADITIYAIWQLEFYTITFDAEDGIFSSNNSNEISLTATYDTKVGYAHLSSWPDDPTWNPNSTDTSYANTFMGWYTAVGGNGTQITGMSTPITQNLTLYAYWKGTYTVTFYAENGTFTLNNSNETKLPAKFDPTVGYNHLTSWPDAPTWNDYTFMGWYTSPDGNGTQITGTSSSITKDLTLYAYWIADPIITFDAQGGNVSTTSQDISYNTSYGTLPIPTRDYFTFDGWFTNPNGDGTQFLSSTIVTKSITVYAFWILNTTYSNSTTYTSNTTVTLDPGYYHFEVAGGGGGKGGSGGGEEHGGSGGFVSVDGVQLSNSYTFNIQIGIAGTSGTNAYLGDDSWLNTPGSGGGESFIKCQDTGYYLSASGGGGGGGYTGAPGNEKYFTSGFSGQGPQGGDGGYGSNTDSSNYPNGNGHPGGNNVDDTVTPYHGGGAAEKKNGWVTISSVAKTQ